MPEFNYPSLSKQQKLAVFLICVGPETAAEVLKQFEDGEVESICREMSSFPIVPAEVRKAAMDEFSGIVAAGFESSLGGLGYAQRALEIAKGDHKAASILGRVGPTSNSMAIVSEIADMDGRQIFNLIKHEQPQTISFVISYLRPAKAAEVFSLLDPELREEVIERLGTIESTSLDLVGKIVSSLGKHFDSKSRPALHSSGGVRMVAALLNSLDKEMSKSLLIRVEERNSELGSAIRRKLFSFDIIGRLQQGDLQRVLREVDPTTLAVSMKSASEALRAKIYSGLPRRAADALRDEIDLLGPVRLRDLEAAQDVVIKAVRRLEESGEITINADPNAMVA